MVASELMFPVIVPFIFMVLVIISGAFMVAWQDYAYPLLNQTATQFNLNATYHNIIYNTGAQLYTFDTYLVIVFFFVMMAGIASTIWLNANPIALIVSVIYIPFIYYITSWIQNIAREILLQPIFSDSLAHLPLSIQVLSQLNTIAVLFALAYVLFTSIRVVWWHKHGSAVLGGAGGGSSGMAY